MAHVVLDEASVHINLSFGEMLLAAHGSVNLPYEHIAGARVESETGWNHMWRKMYGTNAPGIKMAGVFWLDGGMAFLDYKSGDNCLVIETKNESFKTVIVEPDFGEDAAALAEAINKKVAA